MRGILKAGMALTLMAGLMSGCIFAANGGGGGDYGSGGDATTDDTPTSETIHTNSTGEVITLSDEGLTDSSGNEVSYDPDTGEYVPVGEPQMAADG